MDRTVRIWDVATGIELAVLVLPGEAWAVAFHPSAPIVACGDRGGNVHLVRLVGLDLGSLVVTAAAQGHELRVRCPACQHRFQIEREQLGNETTCRQDGCNTRLRINPFVIQQPALRKRNWLSRLLKK
jgi:WD40 repeat protein